MFSFALQMCMLCVVLYFFPFLNLHGNYMGIHTECLSAHTRCMCVYVCHILANLRLLSNFDRVVFMVLGWEYAFPMGTHHVMRVGM